MTNKDVDNAILIIEELRNELKRTEDYNARLKGRISKLESELSVNEDLLKIKNDFQKNVSDNIPFEPIEVAEMLINAKVEHPSNQIQKAFGAGETCFVDKYSNSDLKEIAEHLLLYCKYNDEVDDEQ